MLSTDFVALDAKSNSITKAACLKEFPEVNQLVGNHKDRTHIVISMKAYMNLTLQLNVFPTHYIINREGIIVKVLSDSHTLKVALRKVSLIEKYRS